MALDSLGPRAPLPGHDAMMRLLLLSLALLAPLAYAETLTGRVVGIADGDTMTVLDTSNQQHQIRLNGIDA